MLANANDLQNEELRRIAPKYRATRLGGIPAGSLEVLGRLSLGRLVRNSCVGVALLMMGIAAEFFRVMSLIVSFVSSPLIFGFETDPVFRLQYPLNLLK